MSIIPSGIKSIYNSFADEMINNDIIGQSCVLYYPPKKVDCNNCVFSSSFGGGGAVNIYLTGGPVPFNFGNCPLCGGIGYSDSQQTESIRLRCYFSKKEWRSVVPNIQIPDADLMTIGFAVDIPKILKCQKLEAVNNMSGYSPLYFSLASQVIPHGFYKDRYFIAFWSLS